MAFQTPIANTDVYKVKKKKSEMGSFKSNENIHKNEGGSYYVGSFFPQTIRDWNALPDSLISSAEDAEDCVAKFTSLVRARD